MNTSQQATDRNFPRNEAYPWRVTVWERDALRLWSIASIFEMQTFAEAEFEAMVVCSEPYGPGIIAMHYVIGEVA